MTKKLDQTKKTLIIRLLRKPISDSYENDNQQLSDNRIWGYYDWAIFEDDSKTLQDLYLSIDQDLNYETIRHYEEQILCAYTDDESVYILENHSKYPLFVITEIIVYQNILQTNGVKLSDIYGYIESSFSRHIQEKDHFQILYSLGYSDLIVTCLCHNYQSIYDAIIEIREKHHKYIKSTYSIYGINQSSPEKWKEDNFQAASIFVSLKTHIDLNRIKKEINDWLNPEQQKNFSIFVFPIFGKYDACIFIQCKDSNSIENVDSLFYNPTNDSKKPPLNENSNFYKDNINYTRTHWYFDKTNIT